MPKKPIAGRSFSSAFIPLATLAALSLPTLAEEAALTEEKALRRALSRPALEDAIEGEVDMARADQIESGIWPNPTIVYAREQTFDGANATAEDYASLTQTFELSGRRDLREEAGARRVKAATHSGESRRIAAAADVRIRFYDVLRHQERVAAIDAWARQMGAIAEIVARREAAGDVSGYDRRRLERERATARARLEVEKAAVARARERLAALLGDETSSAARDLVVAGTLLPSFDAPPNDAAVARVASRPDLRALAEATSAADLETRAAARWWVPELTLSGGLKSVDVGSNRADGFTVALSLSIPIFDRDQDDRLRARARARLARGEHALEIAEARGEARGLFAQAMQLHASARTFRTEALEPSAELAATAEAAYRGGELGILELLDAHTSALAAELECIDLESGARRAWVELERVTGGTER